MGRYLAARRRLGESPVPLLCRRFGVFGKLEFVAEFSQFADVGVKPGATEKSQRFTGSASTHLLSEEVEGQGQAQLHDWTQALAGFVVTCDDPHGHVWPSNRIR